MTHYDRLATLPRRADYRGPSRYSGRTRPQRHASRRRTICDTRNSWRCVRRRAGSSERARTASWLSFAYNPRGRCSRRVLGSLSTMANRNWSRVDLGREGRSSGLPCHYWARRRGDPTRPSATTPRASLPATGTTRNHGRRSRAHGKQRPIGRDGCRLASVGSGARL